MCHFPAAVKREASVETGDTIAFLYEYAMNQPSIGGITVDLGHPGLYWDESLFESDTDVIELLTSLIQND